MSEQKPVRRGPGAPRKYINPSRRNIIGEAEILDEIESIGGGKLSRGVSILYAAYIANSPRPRRAIRPRRAVTL